MPSDLLPFKSLFLLESGWKGNPHSAFGSWAGVLSLFEEPQRVVVLPMSAGAAPRVGPRGAQMSPWLDRDVTLQRFLSMKAAPTQARTALAGCTV